MLLQESFRQKGYQLWTLPASPASVSLPLFQYTAMVENGRSRACVYPA